LSLKPDTPITIVGGEEYTNNSLKGWEHYLVRVYTLDDGSKWTARMVVDSIPKCTSSCARARLKKYTDPKKIFRPVRKTKTHEGKFVDRSDMLDGHNWYKDPMTKLLMKNI
tara:strand:+ start:472 stop:804 length:333 start_codon:yes stop_codon:yes gene_type:complete